MRFTRYELKRPNVALRVASTGAARIFGLCHDPQISLLTDFGTSGISHYELESAIGSITSHSNVRTITHEVPAGNVLIGAWRLWKAARRPTEQSGIIYVAVVDPGVGTDRKGIVVRTQTGKYLVGPDNGLLSLVTKEQGIDRAVAIENRELTLLDHADSDTFHGRDVFVPVAAHLARGVPIEEFGSLLDPATLTSITLLTDSNTTHRKGSIVDIDHVGEFGNIATTVPNHLPQELIGSVISFRLRAPGIELDARARLARTFADGSSDDILFVPYSTGSLHLAVNRGNAAKRVGLSSTDIQLDGKFHPAAYVELDLAHAT
ncbi:MAG: SAM-dependent chlorinase/fluorinase [Candidatus Micrarchaeota archaeon]